MTRVIFAIVTPGVILMTGLVFCIFLFDEIDRGDIILTVGIDSLVILGWLLIPRGHWRISAYFLPLLSLTIAGYIFFTAGPGTAAILQIVLGILIAGMLSGNRARWIVVVLSVLVYLVTGWVGGWLNFEVFLTSSILLIITLLVIAFLESFFTDQLNNTLVKVREREEKLQSIFRVAPVGIGMVVDRIIQEANPTLCQMTGYTREELIGKRSRIFYPTQEEYDFVGAEKYRQISEQGIGTVETRWRRKDGAIRDILISSVPLDMEDLSKGVTFSALDITERKQAQVALQTSKNLLRESQKIARMGHYALDISSGIWESSEGLNELFGIGPTYLCDVGTWLKIVHPEDREMMSTYFSEKVLKEGQNFDREYRIMRVNDGATRWVHGLGRLEFDHAGNPIRMIGNIQDITERKQVEQALHESEERYRQAVENSPNPIFSIDRQGTIQTWNRACEKAFLYDHTLVGQPYHILLRSVEDRVVIEEMLDKLGVGQSLSNVDIVYRCQDGGECFMVSRIYPLCNQQKEIQGYVFANTDITERKETEIRLRESAARYRAVVETQSEFIVRWKPDGARTFVNEAYLRYFGLTMEEALSGGFMPLIVEDDRRAVEEKISRLFSGEVKSETDTHRVIRPDGSIGWQEWTDTAIYNIKGELVEFQSIGRDITERMLADEALRTKTEELEALFSISSHLRAAQSADAMLPVVIGEMRRVLHSDANAVILLDPDHEHFTYALGDGPLKVNDGMHFNVEKSISGVVLQTRQPYVAKDLSSDPRKTSTLQGDDGLGPAIVVPVISESEFLGVLLCARNKDSASQQYSSSEVRLLTAIGEMVGNAMRRARLYDQALKRLQHLQTLHSIDTAISANLDLSLILDVLLTQGIAQLDVDAACVMLLDPHTHTLKYAAGKGFRSKEIGSARLRLGEGLPGKVALDRKGLHIPNLSRAQGLCRKYLLEEGFVSYKAAPLIAKGQLQGVLEIFKRQPMSGGEEQSEFLDTLATQAAIAIDNSQLFSELQRSNFELEMAYDATIEGWSRALELRDLETEGHTLRVTEMTLRLAREIGVKSADMIHIRRGALLHDIGKVGVPDRILLKPGKLVDEEWEIMKKHTVYAFEMLRPIEFLRQAIDIPYCHHERWDGTGYPRQLRGEQIPLSARLFTVADVWDALTNDRPYRNAWSEEEALDYIVSNAGKHFDPRVVDLFMMLRNKNSMGMAFP